MAATQSLQRRQARQRVAPAQSQQARSLQAEEFSRRLRHPVLGAMTVDNLVGHYAWHGRHHVAHITSLREREGWK